MSRMIKCPVTGEVVERGFGNFEADLTPGVRLVVHVFEVTRDAGNKVTNVAPTRISEAAASQITGAVSDLGKKLKLPASAKPAK